MSNLRQLFYVSRMAEGVDDRVIRNILSISRRNNRMSDVTGCLTCTGRHFAQVLEGRESVIDELRLQIAADPRHTDFRLLLDRPLTLREYPLWSMAYVLKAHLATDIEGLFEHQPVPRRAAQIVARLKPDTVMGAL